MLKKILIVTTLVTGAVILAHMTTDMAHQNQVMFVHKADVQTQPPTLAAPTTNSPAVPTSTPMATPDGTANPQPAPSTTPTTTTTTPPVTVTAVQKIAVDDNGSLDCLLTYSDGTTYQWHWKVVNPQGSWVTDSNGANGHWVASTQTTGTCDDSLIGSVKAS